MTERLILLRSLLLSVIILVQGGHAEDFGGWLLSMFVPMEEHTTELQETSTAQLRC